MPTPPYTVVTFLAEDNPRGLFPLDSTLLYIKHGTASIKAYVWKEVLDPSHKSASFLSAPVCYALKDSCHLRKLLGLDPLAAYFLYEFVLSHAIDHFQVSKQSKKRRFGYAFKHRRPLPASDQYHEFRRVKYALKAQYPFFAKVDVSNCFNSFYHHDVSRYVADAISDIAAEQFGKFLREINSGTSVNCFPQGVYPAKTVGNFYLSFIEESAELQSPAIIRFLDDVYLFSKHERRLRSDVMILQQILGVHNMHLNSEKTRFGSGTTDFDERKIDAVKKRLLRKREEAVGYDDEGHTSVDLEEAERDYLEQIVREDKVAEEDLELALSLINEGATVVRLVELVCEQHPQLIKHVDRLVASTTTDDDGAVWEMLVNSVKRQVVSEYELFWIAKIILANYQFDSEAASVLTRIAKHPNATSFVKAAVLECPANRHGFLEMKESQLRSSPANITGIAALMGLREASRAKRNHLCGYVSKAGAHMKLYSDIVKSL